MAMTRVNTKVKNVGEFIRSQRSGAEMSLRKLAKLAGVPRVQAKALRFTGAPVANGPPTAFWHMRQWQICTPSGIANSA